MAGSGTFDGVERSTSNVDAELTLPYILITLTLLVGVADLASFIVLHNYSKLTRVTNE